MMNFSLLWFEDNIKNFSKIIPELEKHCLLIDRELSYKVYDYYPEDFDVQMFEGAFSLAFIDLNLRNGQKGVQIIEMLREKGTFMDILLYSNNPSELETLTEGDNYVEGVFRHATMNGIEQKMKDIIDQCNYKEIMTLRRHGY
jgi:hypothetical protein